MIVQTNVEIFLRCIADTLEYDPNFEYGQYSKYMELWCARLKKYNQETRNKRTKEERAAVLNTYKKVIAMH